MLFRAASAQSVGLSSFLKLTSISPPSSELSAREENLPPKQWDCEMQSGDQRGYPALGDEPSLPAGGRTLAHFSPTFPPLAHPPVIPPSPLFL